MFSDDHIIGGSVDCLLFTFLHIKGVDLECCAVLCCDSLRCALPLSDLDVKAAAEMSSFPYVLIQLSADSIFTAQRIK